MSGNRSKQRGKVKKPHIRGGGALRAEPAPTQTNRPPGSDDTAEHLRHKRKPVWGCLFIETPASVDIVTQQTMQDQGDRTTTDTAAGAVGVLSATPPRAG